MLGPHPLLLVVYYLFDGMVHLCCNIMLLYIHQVEGSYMYTSAHFYIASRVFYLLTEENFFMPPLNRHFVMC